MSEPADPATATTRRLNPFAFPAETDQRFALFAIAAVMWVLNWARLIGEILTEVMSGGRATMDALAWQLALPAVVILAATVLYLKHPARIIRQQGLRHLESTRDVSLQAEVERLAGTSGLQKTPDLMLRKANQAGGQAFGLRGRHVVRLDDGLRLALRRAPQMFRAIVLHELAHIVNRDIGRTYFAQALWSATLWLAVIPYLAVLVVYKLIGSRVTLALQVGLTDTDLERLLTTSLPSFLLLLLQFIAGAVMAYCIRASLLRTRETYADWRAASWGAEQSLGEILQRSATTGRPTKAGLRAWGAGLLTLHPTPQDRLSSLRAPERLFRAKPETALFVGWLTATIILGAVEVYPWLLGILSKAPAYLLTIVENAMSTASDIAYRLLLMLGWLSLVVVVILALAPLIAVCVMVMGSLGLEVLREAVRDLQLDRHGFRGYVRLLMPSVLLVLGLYLGTMTSPDAYMFSAGPTVLRLSLIQLPIASAFVWICLAGLRLFGGRLLGSQAGPTPPVARRRVLYRGFQRVHRSVFASVRGMAVGKRILSSRLQRQAAAVLRMM